MSNIVFVSNFSFKGSGFLNISIPLCNGLAALGHDVKAIGLEYTGEEHPFDFSIIPCPTLNHATAMIGNLHQQWKIDAVIIALDIPYLDRFARLCTQMNIKTIAITPLENPPLTLSWNAILQQMNKVFFISQLGEDEARKVGLEAEHLVVGMDTDSWRLRTTEEYKQGRKMMNISPDTLVVITVADNQERKHLSKAYEIMSKVKHEKGRKIKYILVTRENAEVGWKLRDLGMTFNIAPDVMIFERGISFRELFSLYAISDAFLLTSKAEGLNLCVLEAMSIGVPVVATACGAIPELLKDGRGFMMETEYSHIDPWGNERRDFPSAESGMKILTETFDQVDTGYTTKLAREYMESRTWDKPIQQLAKALEELK